MANCATTCGFYGGNWYDLTQASSNVFTNYYPASGSTYTKPGIVVLTGSPGGGGGAVSALW